MADNSPLSYLDFSSQIKAKYPAYQGLDDLTLAQKVVEKYPVYADKVNFFRDPTDILPNAKSAAAADEYSDPRESALFKQVFNQPEPPDVARLHQAALVEKAQNDQHFWTRHFGATPAQDAYQAARGKFEQQLTDQFDRARVNTSQNPVQAANAIAQERAETESAKHNNPIAFMSEHPLKAAYEGGVGGVSPVGTPEEYLGVKGYYHLGKGTYQAAVAPDMPSRLTAGTEAMEGLGETLTPLQYTMGGLNPETLVKFTIGQNLASGAVDIAGEKAGLSPEARHFLDATAGVGGGLVFGLHEHLNARPSETAPAPDSTPVQAKAQAAAEPFQSKKVGGAPSFSIDERIQGSQFRLSQLRREKQTAPAEQHQDYDDAIARETTILADLKDKKNGGGLGVEPSAKPMPGTAPVVENGQVTQAHVAQENDYFQKAKAELGDKASISQIAQQLKKEGQAPAPGTTFTSQKVGGGIDFPIDERIVGSQMRLAELKKFQATDATPEEKAETEYQIAREQSILNDLKDRKRSQASAEPRVTNVPLDVTRNSGSMSSPEPSPAPKDTMPDQPRAAAEGEYVQPLSEAKQASIEDAKDRAAVSRVVQLRNIKENLDSAQSELDGANRALKGGFARGARTPEQMQDLADRVADLKDQYLSVFRLDAKHMSDDEAHELISQLEEPNYEKAGKVIQLNQMLEHDKVAKFLRKALKEDSDEGGLSQESIQGLQKLFPNENITRRLSKGQDGLRTRIYTTLGYEDADTTNHLNARFNLLKFIPKGEKGQEMLDKVEVARGVARDLLEVERQQEASGSKDFNPKRKEMLEGLLAQHQEDLYGPAEQKLPTGYTYKDGTVTDRNGKAIVEGAESEDEATKKAVAIVSEQNKKLGPMSQLMQLAKKIERTGQIENVTTDQTGKVVARKELPQITNLRRQGVLRNEKTLPEIVEGIRNFAAKEAARTKEQIQEPIEIPKAQGKLLARKGDYLHYPVLATPKVRADAINVPEESPSYKFAKKQLPGEIKEISARNLKDIMGEKFNVKNFARMTPEQRAHFDALNEGSPERANFVQSLARSRVAALRDKLASEVKNNYDLVQEIKQARGIKGLSPFEQAFNKMMETGREPVELGKRLPESKEAPVVQGAEKVEAPAPAQEKAEASAPSVKEDTKALDKDQVSAALEELKKLDKKSLTGIRAELGLKGERSLTRIAKAVVRSGQESNSPALEAHKVSMGPEEQIFKRTQQALRMGAKEDQEIFGSEPPKNFNDAVARTQAAGYTRVEGLGSPSEQYFYKEGSDYFRTIRHWGDPEEFSYGREHIQFDRDNNPFKGTFARDIMRKTVAFGALPTPEAPEAQPQPPKPPIEAPPAEEAKGDNFGTALAAHKIAKGLEGEISKLDPAAQAKFFILRKAAEEVGGDRAGRYSLYQKGLETYLDGLKKGNPWVLKDALETIRKPAERGSVGVPGKRGLSPQEIQESYRVYAHVTLDRYEKMTDLQVARMRDKINDGVLERAVRESKDPAVLQRFEALRDKAFDTDPVSSIGSAIINGVRVTPEEAGKGIMRQRMGEQKLDKVQLRKSLDDYAKRWDKASINESVAFIDAIEQGGIDRVTNNGNVNQAHALTGDDKKVAEKLALLLDDRMIKVKALGEGFFDNYLENYFPHIWSNVGKARDVVRQTILSRRPLAGTNEFLKKREYDTFRDGLAEGLQPLSWNPVKITLARIEQIDKFLAAHKMKQDFLKEGLVKFFKAGADVPRDWVKLDDSIFRAEKRDQKTGAIMRFGDYYAPKELAKAFNNHLSPGLTGNRVFDIVRQYGNGVNQANLVGGVFHLIESGFNTTVSDLALSLQQATTKGQRLAALKSLGRMPVSVVDAYFNSGRKMMAEAASPGTFQEYARSVDAMAKAGGSLTIDPQYLNQSLERLRTNWKTAMDQDSTFKTRAGAVLRVGANAVGTLLEKSNWFVMEHFVPRMKAATFHRMAEQIYDKMGSNPNPTLLRMELDRAWDSVDNRLGELIYDNLFWNRMAKDVALVTFRSTGWNLGTVREIGGGAMDLGRNIADIARKRPTSLSTRSAYTIALTGTVMGVGAAMTYFATGHAPQSLADYFYPPDGTTGPDGKPNRHYLKSYVHDVNSIIPFDQTGFNPDRTLTTIFHKVSPLLSQTSELIRNQDYYGREIFHPGDGILQDTKNLGKYAGHSAMPFFYQNYQEEQRRDATTSSKIEALFGILPAPKWAGQTKAETLAYKLAMRSMPQGPRDQEDFDRSQEVAQLRNKFANKNASITDMVKEAQDGKIRYSDINNIVRESGQTPLERHLSRLSAKDALQVWDAATPEEKAQIRLSVLKKYSSIYKDAGPQDLPNLQQKFLEILKFQQQKKTAEPGGAP